MPNVPHVTLAKVFPDIFPNASTATKFTNASIRQMIDLAGYNSMDGACYTFDSSIASDTINSRYESANDGYVLYYKGGSLAEGTQCWAPFTSPTEAIVDASEVYLHIKTSDRYICIYDLISLDINKLLQTTTAFYVAAAIGYAMSCVQLKQMDLNVENLVQLNDELERVNKVMAVLTAVRDDLASRDVIVNDIKNLNTKQMDTVSVTLAEGTVTVVDFLYNRHLLDKELMGGKSKSEFAGDNSKLNANKISFWIDSLRIYYEQCNGLVSMVSSNMQANSNTSSQASTFANSALQSRGRTLTTVVGNIR
ncbi:MAG: hypothetical protein LBP65_00180 [Puniceicoccales bacterium]|jgi:hypothetical protein|nr:hypothetical protein [Puniceicoccales bacterium]